MTAIGRTESAAVNRLLTQCHCGRDTVIPHCRPEVAMTQLVVSITLAVVVALGSVSVRGQQDRAETALRAAIETETVKGDVNGAIAQYQHIVAQHRANRQIAAQALLRLADAYRRLGDAPARAAYQRLVRDH